MRQLLYVSESSAPVTERMLIDILRESRANNGLNGVTGILWADGHRFAHVLEGHCEVVDETFIRILGDRRHRDIEVLDDRSIDKRQFGDWSMAQPVLGEFQQLYAERLLARLEVIGGTISAAFRDIALGGMPLHPSA